MRCLIFLLGGLCEIIYIQDYFSGWYVWISWIIGDNVCTGPIQWLVCEHLLSICYNSMLPWEQSDHLPECLPRFVCYCMRASLYHNRETTFLLHLFAAHPGSDLFLRKVNGNTPRHEEWFKQEIEWNSTKMGCRPSQGSLSWWGKKCVF